MSPARLEFCSDAWVERARVILEELVGAAEPQLRGIVFRGSETFTDAPAHLVRPGETDLHWSFIIDDGRAIVSRARCDEADFRFRKAYQAALPNARALHAKDPVDHPEVAHPGIPLALSKLFFDFHNALARETA